MYMDCQDSKQERREGSVTADTSGLRVFVFRLAITRRARFDPHQRRNLLGDLSGDPQPRFSGNAGGSASVFNLPKLPPLGLNHTEQ